MKYFSRLILLSLSLLLVSCKQDANTLRVGTIAGPETSLMEVAKDVASNKYQLNIVIKTFSDYVIPNIALNDGSIDANVFQHQPYLDATIKARGYPLVSIGKTFLYPMAIYSKKITRLADLKDGALVALPNDPSNEARALLLLQKAKLITLSKSADATVLDIITNPKNLKFKTLTAPQLPRSLADVDLAIINSNYAVVNNLSPTKDSLFIEDKTSPYANVIVVHEKDKNNLKLKQLVQALNSPEVLKKAKELFGEQGIPAW